MYLLKNIDMKNIKIILLIISFCIAPTINAGFLSKIAKAFGVKDDSPIMSIASSVDGVGNAYVAKKVDETIKEYGGEYKDDPYAREGLYDLIGVSTEDLNKAKQWEESDKFGKRDMVIEGVANVAEKHMDPLIVNYFKKQCNADSKYLREKANGNPEAITNRAIDFINIFIEADTIATRRKYELNKEIRAKKIQIKQELIDKGFNFVDEQTAYEYAGIILSVQNDKRLTEAEKIEWLTDLGFYGKEKEILNIAEQINNTNIKDLENPIKAGPTPEEIAEAKRKELEEKERLEREKKENAISQINQTIVNEYAISNVELNDIQKSSLDSVANIMTQYNDINIKITGHTCNIGYKAVNEKIGQKRSDKAKAYLIEKGINEERIISNSMGEDCPKYENTKENRKLNRRIEFIVE